MAKMKVADLPQEEQEKLIAEIKECKLGGVYTTYTVENAKKAIEKKKAQAQNTDGTSVQENTSQNAPQDVKPAGETQEDGEVQKDAENGNLNGGENEETGENGENSDKDGSDNESTGETGENSDKNGSDDESTGENDKNDNEVIVAGDGGVHKIPAENKELEKPQKAKTDEPILICHICRSRVYKGVCSGCGNKI